MPEKQPRPEAEHHSEEKKLHEGGDSSVEDENLEASAPNTREAYNPQGSLTEVTSPSVSSPEAAAPMESRTAREIVGTRKNRIGELAGSGDLDIEGARQLEELLGDLTIEEQ